MSVSSSATSLASTMTSTTKTLTSFSSKPATSATSKPCFRWLSSEELVAKRANRECHHYPEKYTSNQKCASKGVLLLELDDDEETEATTEELGISLHALIGIDAANTVKLNVSIGGQTGPGGHEIDPHIPLRGHCPQTWPLGDAMAWFVCEGRQWGAGVQRVQGAHDHRGGLHHQLLCAIPRQL
jgi:hypothetical protein